MSMINVMRSILLLAGGILLALVANVPLAHAQSCPANEGTCPKGMGGGCAPMGSICCPNGTHVSVGDTCDNDQAGNWGALATVEYKDSSGSLEVAAGYGLGQSTLSLASTAALYNCLQSSGGNLCHIVGTFSNGNCGYVAVGHNKTDVTAGVGDTPSKASAECTSGGYTCKEPIGGCAKVK